MRIEFECSGGYGGLFAKEPLSYRVDTGTLPKDLGDELLRLIDASGLLERDAAAATGKPGMGRDVFNYRISIRDQGSAKTFVFDDISAPPAARPLLNYLRQRAIEQRQA